MSPTGNSAYLDDLDVTPGEIVICKADIVGSYFTPKRQYLVMPNGMLIDDMGDLCVPSARFYKRKTK